MKFVIEKVFCRLRFGKKISMLMIFEIALGMSILIYSLNMFYSLEREEREIKGQDRDLVLEISVNEDTEELEEAAFTDKDYKKVQEITDGNTYMYVVIPQIYPDGDTIYDFPLVLMDYNQLGLNETVSYWGAELWQRLDKGFHPALDLQSEKMPKHLEKQVLKTEMKEISLKNCVIAPISYMDQFQSDISSASIHVEWDSKKVPDLKESMKKVEDYLNAEHSEWFQYRIYSPDIELKNNSYETKISIQVITQIAVLFLLIFFCGMLAVFQLRFENREETYGISLACGAQYRQLFWEIFLEILWINGVGTLIGILAGCAMTLYLDLGIMIGAVKVLCEVKSIFVGMVLYFVMTLCVSGLVYRRLKKKSVINLLHG